MEPPVQNTCCCIMHVFTRSPWQHGFAINVSLMAASPKSPLGAQCRVHCYSFRCFLLNVHNLLQILDLIRLILEYWLVIWHCVLTHKLTINLYFVMVFCNSFLKYFWSFVCCKVFFSRKDFCSIFKVCFYYLNLKVWLIVLVVNGLLLILGVSILICWRFKREYAQNYKLGPVR